MYTIIYIRHSGSAVFYKISGNRKQRYNFSSTTIGEGFGNCTERKVEHRVQKDENYLENEAKRMQEYYRKTKKNILKKINTPFFDVNQQKPYLRTLLKKFAITKRHQYYLLFTSNLFS